MLRCHGYEKRRMSDGRRKDGRFVQVESSERERMFFFIEEVEKRAKEGKNDEFETEKERSPKVQERIKNGSRFLPRKLSGVERSAAGLLASEEKSNGEKSRCNTHTHIPFAKVKVVGKGGRACRGGRTRQTKQKSGGGGGSPVTSARIGCERLEHFCQTSCPGTCTTLEARREGRMWKREKKSSSLLVLAGHASE
ncbi:hypothetical protein HNY73_001568 [Argiope bruennichi]|uniref:Uncharacterized protein n=1 Tax=Argiope bruennichi TaxID=94029 RepID=A0A8T0G434_ARGBR|nr:hypothetical protein HNY73_001568 [Argiope bruennichi]